MRCKVCVIVTRTAGRKARDRRICGACWYKVKSILHSLYKTCLIKW